MHYKSDDIRSRIITCYTITGLPKIFTMEQRQKSKIEAGADAVALYHVIYKHEGFEESAQNLFKLVQQAQRLVPCPNGFDKILAI